MSQRSLASQAVQLQVGIESFRLRPDGEEVVFVRRHVEGDTYRSHLWSMTVESGHTTRLTRGKLRDSSPTYSADGEQLAFVRTPEGADHGQLWLLPLGGGEPWQLSHMPNGVSSVQWSPDGRWLALIASSDDVPFVVGGLHGDKAPRARRITRLDWRDDDAGHRDRRNHIFLLEPVEGATPQQLTRGDYDVSHISWAPDSRTIAFAADRRARRDLDPGSSIWAVAVDDGATDRPLEPVELAALEGNADYPAFSPDGRWLAFLGQDRADPADHEPWQLWLMPAAGGEARIIAEDRERYIGGWAWTELDLAESVPGPAWLDEGSLSCLVSRRARVFPARFSLHGAEPEALVEQDRLLASGVASAAGRIVISGSIDGRAGELYAAEGGQLRRLTTDGSTWQRQFPRPLLEEVEIPGPAGPINTWLVSPADAGQRALPLVLHFHGGPNGAFGPGSSLDALVLTSAGYRVAMPNIRGSTSFGHDWARALDGRWGEVDREDALAVADWLVEQGLADAGRIGLYGLSYGGFLVQWLIGVTDRFAAAVAENGVTNQVSAWANCHFAVYWNRRLGLANPLSREGMLKLWASSPLSNVARISTPLLILQAEEDRICPPADNEQLFTALRVLGRQVEYVLYPEEHHEMKVYGRPDRRIDRHQRMLEWFERYVLAGGGA